MIREGQEGFVKYQTGKNQVKVHPGDESVINDGGVVGRTEVVVTRKEGQGPRRASPIQNKEAVLINQVQEVTTPAKRLFRRTCLYPVPWWALENGHLFSPRWCCSYLP